MEVSCMQSSALRCPQFFEPSTSGCSKVFPSSALVSGRSIRFAKSGSDWKRVNDFGHLQRSVRRASSGGTRRDHQKIVARTQKRRSRHVKGVTPTKDELLDQLAAEEEADEELERTFPDIDEEDEAAFDENEGNSSPGIRGGAGEVPAEDDSFVLQDKPSSQSELVEEQDSSDSRSVENLEKYWESIGKVNVANTVSEDSLSMENLKVETERWDQAAGELDETTSFGSEEIVENDDNSFTVRFFPEGYQGDAQKQVNRVATNIQESTDQAGSVAGQVSNITQDTAKDVTNIAQSTVKEIGENLQEAGVVVGENVEEGLDQVRVVVEELTDTAQDTAQDVASTVQKTVEDSGESLSEAGDAIRESLHEVVSEGAHAPGEQEGQNEAEKNLSEFRSQLEEADERVRGALEKISAEADKSAEKVGDSLASQVVETVGTAGVIGGEALSLGEVIVNTLGEAAGFTLETGTANGNGPKQGLDEKPAADVEEGTKKDAEEVKSDSIDGKKKEPSAAVKEEDKGLYVGLKVTVAGATGRTGRLIVEELVSRGVPVRAMVRDPTKARDLGRMPNVEVVKAELYNYEGVKKALGDSNVVICAIGASGLFFDPIGTYQVEFEGVKNLVAAAKNGGKIKKFVFITTIGVSFLQIVPLIFWKKQAELYLQRSGLDYTIIRPGGLKNGVDKAKGVLVKPADSQFGGSITRRKVAELCVAAVITPEASEKVVEVVSGGRGGRTPAELFGNVNGS